MTTTTEWGKNSTYHEILGPAMSITDQAEADAYFERLVEYTMRVWGKSRELAEATQRSNLGYFAGYYDNETRARVEHLFRCAHPIFGTIAEKGVPTPEEAYAAGVLAATSEKQTDKADER